MACAPRCIDTVQVSDHETGGLTLGRDGEYYWLPELLEGVKRSTIAIREYVMTRTRFVLV